VATAYGQGVQTPTSEPPDVCPSSTLSLPVMNLIAGRFLWAWPLRFIAAAVFVIAYLIMRMAGSADSGLGITITVCGLPTTDCLLRRGLGWHANDSSVESSKV